jgi:hypothetical protein
MAWRAYADMKRLQSELKKWDPATDTRLDDSNDSRFTCFSDLPTEMRLKIWREALPGPRILEFHITLEFLLPAEEGYIEGEGEDSDVEGGLEKLGSLGLREMGHSFNRRDVFEVNHPPPLLLSVCHEARLEALRKYSCAYGPDIPFDTREDIFFVSRSFSLRKGIHSVRFLLREPGSSTLRRLAVDSNIWVSWFSYAVARNFEALEEFTLIVHEAHCQVGWRVWDTDIAFAPLRADDVFTESEQRKAANIRGVLELFTMNHPGRTALKFSVRVLLVCGLRCCHYYS